MASIKPQFLGSNICFSTIEPRYRSVAHFGCCRKPEGITFKLTTSGISNSRPRSSNFCKHSLTGYGSKRKAICVSTPNTSVAGTMELLDAYEDEYDGAIIDSGCLPASANAFAALLQSSLSYWKLKGKKGIWLKLLEDQADLVPIALKEGFSYHHAEPGYIMLTYWIPDEPCMLPPSATHQVGVGAFVINENGEVLVVKEKKCPSCCSGIWKFPTGLINKSFFDRKYPMTCKLLSFDISQSEEIFSGAIREVKEETGVNTSFLEVVAFRHAHNVIFEKSDMFFVCMLKPLSSEITIDESEIEAAKWMPLHEFLDQPFHRKDAMLKNVIRVCVASYENQYRGFTARQMMSKFDDRLSHLYYGDLK